MSDVTGEDAVLQVGDDAMTAANMPAGLFPTATRYVFSPQAMFEGDPMDSAHLYDPHVITVEWRGGATWAVSLGHGWSSQRVWDFDAGEWEWEPQPSSRDEAFLARCRRPLSMALIVASTLANVHGEATDG